MADLPKLALSVQQPWTWLMVRLALTLVKSCRKSGSTLTLSAPGGVHA